MTSAHVPPGWTESQISDLLEPLQGGRPLHHGWSPQCERLPAAPGEWGVLKTTAIQDGAFIPEHNKALPPHLDPRPHLEVREGDILMTCAGPRARCGVVCMVPRVRSRLMLSGKMYRFRARPDLMDPTLLVSYLRSPVAQRAIDRMKTGISDSGLNLTHGRFGRLAIPVPPRSEQRRIVDKIDELLSNLDGGVAALERAKANLARYRAAVLKAAVEGRLTEEWRTRRGRIAVPRGAYELPDGWRMATIGEIADEVRYGTSAKTSKSSQGVPVLRMGNIRDGRLSLDELKYLPDAHDEFPALFLKPGDLLFNRTNSAELVGKSAVYHGTPAPCSFASYLIRVRLRKGIQPEYVNCVINSVYGRRWIRSVVSQQVGQANVNGTKLRALSIPLPPADEQTEIVRLVGEAFDAAERAVSDLTANGERAQTLRQAILALAFSGALWVNR